MSGGPEQTAKRLVDLAAAREPRCGDTRVILVDGRSGGGKTLLAQAVAAELTRRIGAPPTVLSMETLYPGWDGLAAGGRRLTSEVLSPIAAGQDAHYREWDWERGQFGDEVTVAVQGWLVVDGCGSADAAARELAVAVVWVDADADERRERALARDGELYRPHWQRWADQELARLAADAIPEHADLIIDTTDGQWSAQNG